MPSNESNKMGNFHYYDIYIYEGFFLLSKIKINYMLTLPYTLLLGLFLNYMPQIAEIEEIVA